MFCRSLQALRRLSSTWQYMCQILKFPYEPFNWTKPILLYWSCSFQLRDLFRFHSLSKKILCTESEEWGFALLGCNEKSTKFSHSTVKTLVLHSLYSEKLHYNNVSVNQSKWDFQQNHHDIKKKVAKVEFCQNSFVSPLYTSAFVNIIVKTSRPVLDFILTIYTFTKDLAELQCFDVSCDYWFAFWRGVIHSMHQLSFCTCNIFQKRFQTEKENKTAGIFILWVLSEFLGVKKIAEPGS